MAGSSFGSGYPDGSSLSPGASETTFVDLRLTVQTVADAFAAPSDSPATDIMRLVQDGTGARVVWTYEADGATWKGVAVS